MRKIKYILATILSAFLVMLSIVVGGKVLATSYDIGSANVTTTTNDGDTKTWDFKVSSAQTLANGDDVNGVVVYGGYNKGSNGTPSIKKDNGGLDFFLHGYVLVPVVSETSEGTISVMLTSNSGGRYIDLISNSGTVTSSVLTSKTNTMDYTFTEDDVWTINEKYYVKLWSEVYTGNPLTPSGDSNSSNSGEIKMGTVSVVLSNGTYGEAAILHTVTYMDGTSTLKTDAEAVEGSNITFTPKKYGYDFEGWYTDSTLDNKIASTYTVTSDVTLYAKWTAWDYSEFTSNYTLASTQIAKIATGIEGSLTSNLALNPTIYTYLSNGAMTTTNVTLPGASSATNNPCFNTGGALTTSQCGIKFTAPANGTFTAYVGVGGTGSTRSVVFKDGTNSINPSEGASTLEFDGTSYEPREFNFEVEAGTTYYLGGTNGVRIYYISFAPTTSTVDSANVEIEAQQSTDGTAVRFITTLTGVDAIDVTSWNVTLTYNGGSEVTTSSFTTLYLAVVNTKEAADGTYYLVFTVSEIPSEANGKVITAAMTVTFEDGSSITTLVKEETILQIA